MARKLRVEYAGACYHVINRGNYRSAVFAARGAGSFQRCLVEVCQSGPEGVKPRIETGLLEVG
jgi:hypothetical protein